MLNFGKGEPLLSSSPTLLLKASAIFFTCPCLYNETDDGISFRKCPKVFGWLEINIFTIHRISRWFPREFLTFHCPMKMYSEGLLQASNQKGSEHHSGHQMENNRSAVANISSYTPSLSMKWSSLLLVLILRLCGIFTIRTGRTISLVQAVVHKWHFLFQSCQHSDVSKAFH